MFPAIPGIQVNPGKLWLFLLIIVKILIIEGSLVVSMGTFRPP